MADLTIYGVPKSRAFRTLWTAGEMRLRYDLVEVDFADGGARTPEFLEINPNGRVPAIDDDGFRLTESMAINLYLAKKYGIDLYPDGLESEALTWQWTFWAVNEIEAPLLTALLNRVVYPEPKRDSALADDAERKLTAPLRVLDRALADTTYLLGQEFTIADLNVASVLLWARGARIDLGAFPKAAAWLKDCLSRPAARAAIEMQKK